MHASKLLHASKFPKLSCILDLKTLKQLLVSVFLNPVKACDKYIFISFIFIAIFDENLHLQHEVFLLLFLRCFSSSVYLSHKWKNSKKSSKMKNQTNIKIIKITHKNPFYLVYHLAAVEKFTGCILTFS